MPADTERRRSRGRGRIEDVDRPLALQDVKIIEQRAGSVYRLRAHTAPASRQIAVV